MNSPSLRIVFAGTPGFAAAHLECLCTGNHNVVAAYTQPDRPAGRGKKLFPTPVKAVAESRGIPVFQPARLDAEAATGLATVAPDVMVVVAYGLILPEAILALPRFGCINVHASLLPRWRGAAPVERAILAGDRETGVSLMQMDAGLDTGDVLLQLATPISASDNAGTLSDRLVTLGCQGLEQVLSDLSGSKAKASKQDNAQATYAAKLAKEEAEIHWGRPALEIQHQVQAFNPRSPAWCRFQGERLRVIQAFALDTSGSQPPGTIIQVTADHMMVACGNGALQISRIQLPGKTPMALQDVFNGHPGLFVAGLVLGRD